MAEAFVDDIIKNHKVVVISKSTCPFCTKAKQILEQYQIDDCFVVEIEERADMDEIQDYCKKLTGARSVPRVFIKGKCIGGGDDTVKLHQKGTLKKLLE